MSITKRLTIATILVDALAGMSSSVMLVGHDKFVDDLQDAGLGYRVQGLGSDAPGIAGPFQISSDTVPDFQLAFIWLRSNAGSVDSVTSIQIDGNTLQIGSGLDGEIDWFGQESRLACVVGPVRNGSIVIDGTVTAADTVRATVAGLTERQVRQFVSDTVHEAERLKMNVPEGLRSLARL